MDAESQAPKPRRRVQPSLIYTSMLLTGAWWAEPSPNLLGTVLDRQGAENRRLEAKVSKQLKSSVEIQQKLDLAHAKRAEAERKLEAAFAESAKSPAERPKRPDETENRPRAAPSAERARNARPPPLTLASAPRKPGPPRTGRCDVEESTVGDLNKCINGYCR